MNTPLDKACAPGETKVRFSAKGRKFDAILVEGWTEFYEEGEAEPTLTLQGDHTALETCRAIMRAYMCGLAAGERVGRSRIQDDFRRLINAAPLEPLS